MKSTKSELGLGTAAAKGIAVTLVGQMAKFVIQSTSIIILARLIAPDEFGLFVMVASISGLAAVIGDFGLSAASIQAKQITQKEKTNLFWINSGLGLVAGTVFFYLAPLVAQFYGREEILTIAQVMCSIFIISGLSVQHKAELSRRMKFTQLTVIEVLSQVVGLAAALFLALLGFGVWALVAQQIAALLIVTLLSWIFSGWLPGLPSRRTSVRSYIYFGANTMGGALTNYASSNIDSVMLGRYAGAETVGIYGRMFQLFSLPLQQLATPLTRVALPILSSIQDEQERYTRFMNRALGCLSYVFLGGFTAIIIIAPYLIPVVLGSQWTPGVPVIQILSIGGIFQGLGYIYYWGFLSRAKTNVMFRLSLVSRSLMVGLIVVAAPHGILMVASAVSLGLLINWAINTTWGVPAISVSRRSLLSQVWRPAAVFVPFGAAGYLFVSNGMLNSYHPVLCIVIALSVQIVYVFVLVLIIKPVRRDITSMVSLVKMALIRKK